MAHLSVSSERRFVGGEFYGLWQDISKLVDECYRPTLANVSLNHNRHTHTYIYNILEVY